MTNDMPRSIEVRGASGVSSGIGADAPKVEQTCVVLLLTDSSAFLPSPGCPFGDSGTAPSFFLAFSVAPETIAE
jgi:hypothetical protein